MADSGPPKTPHFARPPVVETVLGVQFAPLAQMRITHYGLLLAALRQAFPGQPEALKVSEHASLEPVIEAFGADGLRTPRVHWTISDEPPLPRCWYASGDEQFLVQVQRDRFIFNWRHPGPDGVYPRYEANQARFQSLFTAFLEFADREALGPVATNQCEVTYVNHIELLEGKNVAETLDAVLTGWKLCTSDGWLTGAVRGQFSASYPMPRGRGRLHVTAHPAFRVTDRKEIVRVDLTARGSPWLPDLDGVRAWLDLGHEWVVRGFVSITTPQVHELWGRIS